MNSRVSCLLTAAFAWMVIPSVQGAAATQSNSPADTATPGGRISINVVVTDKKGQPVRELQAGGFTVFDNDEPQKLLAFRPRVLGDATASYLLTFKTAHANSSDKCHAIAVRVDRPNLNVRTIRGYCPHPQF